MQTSTKLTTFGKMPLTMFRIGEYFEVVYSVIKLISVNVVNMLFSVKFSSKVLFHNIAVFEHILTITNRNPLVTPYVYIPTLIIPSLSSLITSSSHFSTLLSWFHSYNRGDTGSPPSTWQSISSPESTQGTYSYFEVVCNFLIGESLIIEKLPELIQFNLLSGMDIGAEVSHDSTTTLYTTSLAYSN